MKCLPLLFLVAACGSSSSKTPDARTIDAPSTIDGPVDAPVDSAIDAPVDAPPNASGTHYHYILDGLIWPTNNNEARADGFDLNNDGTVDNQLGSVMASLSAQGFDVQAAQTQAVDRGSVLMLADLQTTDLATATDAGYTMYVGTNPSPAPCSGSGDTVCRHHLTGTGSFDVAATPRDPQLIGSITAGQLTAGPGHLSMQLLIMNSTPVTVTLLAAHAQLTATSTAITQGKLGGAVSMSDIQSKVYPGIQQGLMATVTADCTGQNPPGCGCTANSSGATTISFFDANQDCSISLGEVENNSLIMSLFAPDVTVEGQMALSVGFAVTGVGATFTP